MTRRNWRRLRTVVLWAALPVLFWLWTSDVAMSVRVTVSLVYAAFLVLAAPVWCGAETRTGDACRNNSTGLLVGCHLRQHRTAKVKAMVSPPELRALARRVMNPTTVAAVVGAVASVASAAAAWTALMLGVE